MPKISENFEIDKVKGIDGIIRQFVVFSKDRGDKDERWVVNCLSYDEARQLYNYLKRYFKQED